MIVEADLGLWSLLPVVLALAEAVITTRLATQDRYDTANTVDRISRWVYLALFVGIFIVQLML